MSSTYSSLHYHVVFSTKGREPWIDSSWRGRLHEYLGGTIGGLNATPIIVGGVVNDHVHLLVTLRPVHCLADFVREVKKASFVWVHEEIRRAEFAWQEGYAAFTVSPSGRNRVRDYIASRRSIIGREAFERSWWKCCNAPVCLTIRAIWSSWDDSRVTVLAPLRGAGLTCARVPVVSLCSTTG